MNSPDRKFFIETLLTSFGKVSIVYTEYCIALCHLARSRECNKAFSSSPKLQNTMCHQLTNMTQQTGPFFRLPAEIRNIVYIHLFSNAREDYPTKSPMSSLETCKQFYEEGGPIFYRTNTFDLDVHCDFITYQFGPKLTSPLIPRSLIPQIQHLRIGIFFEKATTDFMFDDDSTLEAAGVEMHLREIVLTLTRYRCRLSSLHIHFPDGPIPYFGMLIGFCELQVNDEFTITGICPGSNLSTFFEPVSERQCAGYWFIKSGMGMYVDLWKYIDTCEAIVNRWPESLSLEKAMVLDALAQAWNSCECLNQLMDGLERCDQTSSPGKSALEAIFQTPVSHLVEIDQIIDRNIDNGLYGDHVGLGARNPKRYMSDARKRLYMRPFFSGIRAGGRSTVEATSTSIPLHTRIHPPSMLL